MRLPGRRYELGRKRAEIMKQRLLSTVPLLLLVVSLAAGVGTGMPVWAATNQPAPPAGALAVAQGMLRDLQRQAAGQPQVQEDFHFSTSADLAKVALGPALPVAVLPDAAVQRPRGEVSTALEPLGWLFPLLTGTTYHGFCYVEDQGGNRWYNGGTFSGSLAQALLLGRDQQLPASLAKQRLTAVGPARLFDIGTNWFILTPTDQGMMILPLSDFPPYWAAGTLYPEATLTPQFARAFAQGTGDNSLPGPHSLPTSWQGLTLIWLLSLIPPLVPLALFIWFVRRQRRKERLDRADPTDQGIAALWEGETTP